MLEYLLIVLAFVGRFATLMPLILIYRFFLAVDGPSVVAFRRLIRSWIFLFSWVTVCSIAELLAFIPFAGSAVEHGAAYIFIPNMLVAIPMWGLYFKLRTTVDRSEGGP